MNTDTRQQIKTALRAFSVTDLRTAALGLLNSLGYRSEKTLDLGGSPEMFLGQFDNTPTAIASRRPSRFRGFPWMIETLPDLHLDIEK